MPFTLVGLALSIFLGFRNNEAYERFWEGRCLWGRLVNVSRTLVRQLFTLMEIPADAEKGSLPADEYERLGAFRREMVYRLIGYAHALRHHLRDTDPAAELAAFLPPEDLAALSHARNVPMLLLQRIGERLAWARHRGWIPEILIAQIDDSLTEIAAIQGGCERIKATPIPTSYTVLMHRIVAVYCLALPFGIIKEVQVLTPLVVLMIAYAFFGLDAIGDEIEEPFGTHANDLPLAAISRTIEINLRQLLGETNLSPPPEPVNGVVL
jgi:putative membrane protein